MKRFFTVFGLILSFNFHALADTYDFAVIGDAGYVNEMSMSVRDSIVETGVHRLILPGDNIYDNRIGYARTWAPWSSMGLTYDVVAIGNHNISYRKEREFFGMPGEYFTKNFGPNVKFIVLNSDNKWNARTQIRWLDTQLQAATEKFIFIVYHHPSLTIQHKWKDKKTFHKGVRPLLFKYRQKITAMIFGHDHLASLHHFNDLPVVISGAVQETRTPALVNNVQEGIAVRTDFMYEPTPYWVRLVVDDQKAAVRLDYVRATDSRVTYSTCIVPGLEASQVACKSNL